MPFQPELIGILENLANRIYTDDFYQLHPTPQIIKLYQRLFQEPSTAILQ